jgi:hypothetical protein
MQYIRVQQTLDGGKIFLVNMPFPLITWRKVTSNTDYEFIEVVTPESTYACYPLITADEIIVKESLAIVSQIEQQLVQQLKEALNIDKDI